MTDCKTCALQNRCMARVALADTTGNLSSGLTCESYKSIESKIQSNTVDSLKSLLELQTSSHNKTLDAAEEMAIKYTHKCKEANGLRDSLKKAQIKANNLQLLNDNQSNTIQFYMDANTTLSNELMSSIDYNEMISDRLSQAEKDKAKALNKRDKWKGRAINIAEHHDDVVDELKKMEEAHNQACSANHVIELQLQRAREEVSAYKHDVKQWRDIEYVGQSDGGLHHYVYSNQPIEQCTITSLRQAVEGEVGCICCWRENGGYRTIDITAPIDARAILEDYKERELKERRLALQYTERELSKYKCMTWLTPLIASFTFALGYFL